MVAIAFVLAFRLAGPSAPPPPAGTYLYRATLLQAAPGRLLEVIDLYKAGWPGSKDSGDEPPLAMRHSQGDRWDLLLLFPMESQSEFFRPERLARRRKEAATTSSAMTRLRDLTAWQE